MHIDYPHRRFNPLTGEWILVSPHRTKRPWQGKVESVAAIVRPAHDPSCYLCPRNERAGGLFNPDYSGVYVFDNDFAALLPDTTQEIIEPDPQGLFVAQPERGLCRVLCFSPRHDKTLALMDLADIEAVVRVWTEQYRELGSLDYIDHVQIFENRGDIMGCSNPHPHGQIWANQRVPQYPAVEGAQQSAYKSSHQSCLLCDYVKRELQLDQRIIFKNEHFAALVPFWAVWPYETMLVPRFHCTDLTELNIEKQAALADAIKRIGIRYDNLFSTHFPYSMGIHQKPTDGFEHPYWHMHFHFYPPLLRSATVKKFMVGYEMLAQPQRDITPEQSAAQLRELSERHFLQV